jgi:hypothetical protein
VYPYSVGSKVTEYGYVSTIGLLARAGSSMGACVAAEVIRFQTGKRARHCIMLGVSSKSAFIRQ